jgi:hypothetical protein
LLPFILIDYHYVLKGVEAPRLFRRKESIPIKIDEPGYPASPVPSVFIKKEAPVQQYHSPPHPEHIAEIQRISNAMHQKIQNVVNDLERKTERIEELENILDQQQQPLPYNEKIISPQSDPSLQRPQEAQQNEETLEKTISTEEKIILKERIENHLIIDDMDHIVAVIQRGFSETSVTHSLTFLAMNGWSFCRGIFLFLSLRAVLMTQGTII